MTIEVILQDTCSRPAPKFKPFDFIISNDGTKIGQIKGIIHCHYDKDKKQKFWMYRTTMDDNLPGDCFDKDSFIEENFHKWTILDAKKGDILRDREDSIFLYNGNFDKQKGTVGAYFQLLPGGTLLNFVGTYGAIDLGPASIDDVPVIVPAIREYRKVFMKALNRSKINLIKWVKDVESRF